ncbi:MAG: transposase [Planctomycetaceae bacterium]|nr:transposase [Planctomycetaceae bacterium]
MAAWTLPQRIAEWCEVLSAGLDRRSRKYFVSIVLGMLLASGRRTVSSWLRAAGVLDDWQDHYYFLQTLGRRAGRVATELLFLVVRWIPVSHVGPYVKLALDDSPTKRYGPKVQLAGIHHNPTPGPAGAEFLYGHVWVTISWLVRHPSWGCIGLPLRALMYVRRKDLDPLTNIGRAPWSFRTKLELAAELVEWCVKLFQNAFHRPVLVVADGAYAKRPFLRRVLASGAHVVSRLRKDAALFDLPPAKRGGRGRPRTYGTRKLSLSGRGAHRQGWTQARMVLYGVEQTVTFKTFLATYRPAGGVIRVVIVKRSAQLFADCPADWVAFFCTDSGVPAETIIESVADRSAIEQNFHDVKEVHGAGQQQVRNVWCNVACWNLCLWLHTLVELWSWRRSGTTLRQRSDRPWDEPSRRPSHADRFKTLRKQVLQESFSALPRPHRAKRKIQTLFKALATLVI